MVCGKIKLSDSIQNVFNISLIYAKEFRNLMETIRLQRQLFENSPKETIVLI